MKKRLFFRSSFFIFALLLCLSLAACSGKGKGAGAKRYPSAGASDAQICRDLVTLPQNLTIYAEENGGSRVLLSEAEQQEQAARQKSRLFRPWRQNAPGKWVKQSLDKNFHLKPDRGYTENLRPFPLDDWRLLEQNTNQAAYPARSEPAITVRHTDLRAMPTAKPFFLNPDKAGEGYPFDYFQHTSLPVGTPIFVCHVSQDGLWVLAETTLSAGWLPVADVAVVDEDFMDRWQSLPLAALVRDKILLSSEAIQDQVTGKPLGVRGHIGALLPLAGGGAGLDSQLTVLYPRRSPSGHAEAATTALPPGAAARVPLTLTPNAVARVGNEMMAQPYGWGGLLENRDCSALTRDIFAPFGLWLPRNSATQGSWGRPVVLSGLSNDEKESKIMAEAVPFLSLVWMRGHIGLYLGRHQGKPVMFHNIWGLRVIDASPAGLACEGRAVIGKAVVTTLKPGVELPAISTPGGLLDRIERVTVLPEVDEKLPVIKKSGSSKKAAGKGKSRAMQKSRAKGKKK